MNHEEITLYKPELMVNALKKHLEEMESDIPNEMDKAFDELYYRIVPLEERREIAKEIEKIEANELAQSEARRRFGVFHVRENGEDSYYLSNMFDKEVRAAYRYRVYSRGELSMPRESLDKAMGEVEYVSKEHYDFLSASRANDPRATAVMDFDLDDGTVAFLDRNDKWSAYKLTDVSVAAYKAYRSNHLSPDERTEIFEAALEGKEIDIDDGEQSPALKM